MYFDIISTPKTEKIEEITKRLNVTVFSLQEFKGLRLVQGKDDITIRKSLEHNQTDILLNPHQGRTKDFTHSRNSGLNQILCTLARKNNIAIGITLDHCYDLKYLGKIMQNIKLCRKYNVHTFLFTFAQTPYGLRNPKDLLSLGKTLGMSSHQAKQAVTGLGEVLKRKLIKY